MQATAWAQARQPGFVSFCPPSAADRKFREPLSERTRVMARNVLYPLYQAGNPQLRIFRTNFFIQLVRPGTAQPEDTVQFRIPMEMTRVDLKNYLQKVYDVPVAAVRTRIQHGSNKKRDHRNVRIKQPDYKVAYVQLFPDLFPEKDRSPEAGSVDDIQNQFMEDERQRQKGEPRRGGVPDWFGL
ncbi:large ribosomal subunit protein uL23m isoform X2 [Petaurus breviceps papuanus]|uniref:large ribosomal subunit protein uL23m isoform X2 n=1 Tax=Petaurus breviceps papuanus TaxID=3040969 RepID=UPI0036D9E6A2